MVELGLSEGRVGYRQWAEGEERELSIGMQTRTMPMYYVREGVVGVSSMDKQASR